MRKPYEWTDRELIEGLIEVQLLNDKTFKKNKGGYPHIVSMLTLNTAWIVSQLSLRRVSERIEQAIIDGMTVCFDEQGELIAVEIDNG